jgi:hypothetical protein
MYDEIYDIKHFIEKLNKQRQIEVLKIFNENNIDISENKNGSFVNLTLLSQDVIDKLKTYIQYIKDQDISLEKIEYVKNDFKSSFFSHNSNTKIDNILNLNKDKSTNKNNEIERNL